MFIKNFLLFLNFTYASIPVVPFCKDYDKKECLEWCGCNWNNETFCNSGNNPSEHCKENDKIIFYSMIAFGSICACMFLIAILTVCCQKIYNYYLYRDYETIEKSINNF